MLSWVWGHSKSGNIPCLFLFKLSFFFFLGNSLSLSFFRSSFLFFFMLSSFILFMLNSPSFVIFLLSFSFFVLFMFPSFFKSLFFSKLFQSFFFFEFFVSFLSFLSNYCFSFLPLFLVDISCFNLSNTLLYFLVSLSFCFLLLLS